MMKIPSDQPYFAIRKRKFICVQCSVFMYYILYFIQMIKG